MQKAILILLLALCFEGAILRKHSKLSKRIALAMKIYHDRNLRNLQVQDKGTDESLESDSETGTSNATEPGPSENISADAPAEVVNNTIPVSKKGYKKNNKDANIQINKFYNARIEPEKPKIFFYNTLFSFLNKIVVQTITLRLRITIARHRLRDLQEDDEIAVSAPSICTINDTSLVGKTGTGSNIKYDCSAETDYNASDITNVTVNTDVPMKVGDETVPFDDVSFNGNATNEAENLFDTGDIKGEPIEFNSIKLVSVSKTNFVLGGKVATDGGKATMKEMLDSKEDFTMDLPDTSSGIEVYREYKCKVSSFDDNSEVGEITCDTSNQPIITTLGQLNGQVSTSDRVITLHADNPNDSTPIDTTNPTSNTNNISYRKNSSGLSGGAIAGIVIACAVVLIAASIVAMMLRKPTPPLDNTTVVGLKTVDNY